MGGSVSTAVMSTIAASVTATYASSHGAVHGFNAAAATGGYATVFLVSALVFAAGSVLAAALFPSKARLTVMRESISSDAATPRANQDTVGEVAAAVG